MQFSSSLTFWSIIILLSICGFNVAFEAADSEEDWYELAVKAFTSHGAALFSNSNYLIFVKLSLPIDSTTDELRKSVVITAANIGPAWHGMFGGRVVVYWLTGYTAQCPLISKHLNWDINLT